MSTFEAGMDDLQEQRCNNRDLKAQGKTAIITRQVAGTISSDEDDDRRR